MLDDTTSEAYRVREQSLSEQPSNVTRADQRQQAVIARRWPAEQAHSGPGKPVSGRSVIGDASRAVLEASRE